MNRQTDQKLILVLRSTRLEELVRRFNTVEQARFYIEHLGADFSDYQREHSTYRAAADEAARQLGEMGRLQIVSREHLPNFIFGPEDIVAALGQDGLVANTLKYLDSQPLIGVNPDPARWDGVLLPFEARELAAVVSGLLQGKRSFRRVTLAHAALNDGQSLLAVNDLFIGQRTHVSARYVIEAEGRREQQSSSGVIVSTGLGSTGWLKSIVAGAGAISSALGGGRAKTELRLPWDADALQYFVREPFVSRTTAAGIVTGPVKPGSALKLTSQMPENGVIFSDGIESDFLQFNSGVEATITVAERKGRLVV